LKGILNFWDVPSVERMDLCAVRFLSFAL